MENDKFFHSRKGQNMGEMELMIKMFEAFANSSDTKHVYLSDFKTGRTRWSQSCVEQFGLPGQMFDNDAEIWMDHVHPDDRAEFTRQMAAIMNGEIDTHDMLYRVRNKDGEYVLCTCKGSVIRDDDGNPLYFAGTLENHSIANEYDPVTSLPTREKFLDTLKDIKKRQTPYYVLFLGLCNFGEINSVHGYEFGNAVLKNFSQKLVDQDYKAGIFHLGGVKFAMISSMYSESEIVEFYDGLSKYTMHGMNLNDTKIILNLAGSLARVDNFDIDEHTVLSSGLMSLDESIYQKHGTLVHFNSTGEEIHDRLKLISDLRESIINNYDGFYLCYHPIVGTKNDSIIGAEALLRYDKEPYGVVPPDKFIPWLESDPLFYDLSNWILRTAMRNWKEEVLPSNPDLVININLSYMQIDNPDFRNDLTRIIEEEAFPTKNLCLELTERCRFMDMSFLRNEIIFLKSKGIKVALDDFGTGFSAMELLINLPVDTIKIDRSFVIDIEDKKENQYVVQALLDCANNLGVRSTVEGIETTSMRDVLKDYGASTLQGYLYSKPIKIDDFVNLDIKGLSKDPE